MTQQPAPVEPTAAAPRAHGQACENCGSVLRGSWCHVCGQHAHNPLKSFQHAVEDVFESFWHLDGRIFRSLRDLLRPGRIARNYLDGQRVRYLPPLRLYVILSLITFFIAHFVAMGVKGGFDIDVRGNQAANNNPFLAETTTEGVEARRAKLLAEIEAAAKSSPAPRSAFDFATAAIDRQADQRITELGGKPRTTPAAAATSTEALPGSLHVRVLDSRRIGAEGGFADRLLRQWEQNAEANVRLFANDRRAFLERLITHVPSVLLVLVPLFALVLRLVYLLRPIGYLEHLVVALYSHSFLLLAAMAWMLVLLIERVTGTTLGGTLMGVAFWIGTPLYLLFSQKRIYGDGWPLTLLRWSVTGILYLLLALFAFVTAMALALAIKG